MTGLGLPRVHHRTLDSTNERAKGLARDGAPHGTLVTAEEQTAGRGRQGRIWLAPPRAALLMSVVVRGLEEHQAVLPLTAAVAVCEAAERTAGVECAIKWPNDVWIDGRKLAGILIEARRQDGVAVVGVGLNVTTPRDAFPEELRETATSLAIESPDRAPGLDAVLAALLAALEQRLPHGPERTLAAWRERDALRGSRVAWAGGEGIAAGVDESGALLVETTAGTVALDSGEVHLER